MYAYKRYAYKECVSSSHGENMTVDGRKNLCEILIVATKYSKLLYYLDISLRCLCLIRFIYGLVAEIVIKLL